MNKIDRYKILIRYAVKNGIADSQKDLGYKLGYKNESSFSQIINEKVSEPKDFIQRLKNLIPSLNERWLLTGQDTMLNDGSDNRTETPEVRESVNKVPLLPLDAIAGSLNDFVASVNKYDCEQAVNPIEGADFAITVSGESMTPEYPNGSRIFIKRIKESAFIDWGRVYVLDTCNGVVVKRLVPSEKDTEKYVRCLSINPDPMYAPFEVAWEDVYGVYRVLLCMSMK